MFLLPDLMECGDNIAMGRTVSMLVFYHNLKLTKVLSFFETYHICLTHRRSPVLWWHQATPECAAGEQEEEEVFEYDPYFDPGYVYDGAPDAEYCVEPEAYHLSDAGVSLSPFDSTIQFDPASSYYVDVFDSYHTLCFDNLANDRTFSTSSKEEAEQELIGKDEQYEEEELEVLEVEYEQDNLDQAVEDEPACDPDESPEVDIGEEDSDDAYI